MASRMASGMGAKLRLIGTWVATAILFSGMVFAGWTGFSWIQQITLSDVAIKGNVNTTASDIQDMIKVDTSMVLYDISAVVLEDRLIRHPWIQQADVARLPSGVLDIRIEERKPVAVILGSNDRPDTWVDAAGWRLPITDRAVYDVPLLDMNPGVWHPMKPIEDPSTLELLRSLARASQEMDALFSEFIRTDSGWELRTTPVAGHDSIPVLLGESGFGRKFQMLQGFWNEQVLQHRNKEYTLIDLRFDSQIVVREQPIRDASKS